MTFALRDIIGMSESDATAYVARAGLTPRVYRREGVVTDYHLPHADERTVTLEILRGKVDRAQCAGQHEAAG